MTAMRLILTAAFAALLSGCAAITSVEMAARPLTAFDLTPLDGRATAHAGGGYMLVERPEASGGLSTDRIMIRPTPLAVQYLPDVKWIEDAPSLVQRLIVESLMASGAFSLVSSRDFGPSPDYVMVGDLVAFQGELNDGAVTVHIRIVGTIMRQVDRRIVSSRVFDATEPAAAADAEDVVAAFDRAMTTALSDLGSWAIATVR